MGASFDWTFDQVFEPQTNWYIDGAGVPEAINETATHDSLTLEFRVSTSVLETVLRPLKSNEGQVAKRRTDDGGFVAVDRANGGNTYRLEPPTRREPLRQAADYHVQRYEESLVSQSVDEWNVEIEFVPSENRADTPSINQNASGATFDWTFDQAFTSNFDGGQGWAFDTRFGQLATDRVDAEFVGTGEGGVRRFELTTRLTFDQSRVFEAALSLLEGVRVREIPDATNVAVDDTGGDSTVTIDAPANATVSDGDYIVSEFESTRLNDGFQSVSFTIAET